MNNGEKNSGVGESEPESDTKKWERKTQKAQRTKLAYFTGRKFRASDWLIFLSRKNRSPIGRPFISLPHSSSCQAPPSRSLRRTMRSLRKKTNRLRGGMNNCRWWSKFCRQKISPGVHPAFGQLQKTRPLASDDSLRTTPIFRCRWENVNCPFSHF